MSDWRAIAVRLPSPLLGTLHVFLFQKLHKMIVALGKLASEAARGWTCRKGSSCRRRRIEEHLVGPSLLQILVDAVAGSTSTTKGRRHRHRRFHGGVSGVKGKMTRAAGGTVGIAPSLPFPLDQNLDVFVGLGPQTFLNDVFMGMVAVARQLSLERSLL